MEVMESYAFQRWAVEFLAVLFLVGGLVALALGVALIGRPAGTLRLLAGMNRWVSTRRAFKPLEVTRDTGLLVRRHRRWLGAAVVAGAAFSIYGLLAGFDAEAVRFGLGLDARSTSVTAWLIESARWVLIVGNAAAIAIGIVLGLLPDALAALEARGSRWYSDRRLVKGGDAMHLPLDNRVAASPRLAGWIIAAAGLFLVSNFATVLSGLH